MTEVALNMHIHWFSILHVSKGNYNISAYVLLDRHLYIIACNNVDNFYIPLLHFVDLALAAVEGGVLTLPVHLQ